MASYENNDREAGRLAPLTEEDFATLVDQLVADSAPHLFALVEEYGQREDGWVVAWGMQFENRAEVVTEGDGPRLNVGSAERASQILSPVGTLRLVWCPLPTLSGDHVTV